MTNVRGLHDTSEAYCPAKVGNVLGSERIYEDGIPLPSLTDGLFLLWVEAASNARPLACESDTVTTRPRWLLMNMILILIVIVGMAKEVFDILFPLKITLLN